MWRFFSGLLKHLKKNWVPTVIQTVIVFAILLTIATFTIPKVLQSSSSGGGYRQNQMTYDMPASAPAEEAGVAGGAGGDSFAARGKEANLERKADGMMLQDTAATSSMDANKGMPDIMTPAYAGEVFKPQIIKTANITLEVENIVDSVKKIENLTTGHGGLITNKNVSITGENNQYRSGVMQVRVPQSRLELFLTALQSMGIPRQETVTSEAVGRAFESRRAHTLLPRVLDEIARAVKIQF